MTNTLNYAGQAITISDAEKTTVLDAMNAATANRGSQGSVVTVAGVTVLIGPSTTVSIATT